MTDETSFRGWIEVQPGERVVFGELAELMSVALHGATFAAAAAQINLEEELPKLVRAGVLVPRDPLTGGPHPFPVGAALESAELKVDDALRAFLADRGIGLRVVKERQSVPAPPPGPSWTLREPRRHQGYSWPLYQALKAAHAAGGAKPKAREVLETFKAQRLGEIVQVNHDGFTYLDANGNAKAADLDAIAEAIRRMTS